MENANKDIVKRMRPGHASPKSLETPLNMVGTTRWVRSTLGFAYAGAPVETDLNLEP